MTESARDPASSLGTAWRRCDSELDAGGQPARGAGAAVGGVAVTLTARCGGAATAPAVPRLGNTVEECFLTAWRQRKGRCPPESAPWRWARRRR
ncbi:MAG TPA: hypothetical protein DEG26_10060 [Chloroflexi bacterium]|jgi:hypothetical protein|nr:hypothetical protein [Chloroflexota bacterium]